MSQDLTRKVSNSDSGYLCLPIECSEGFGHRILYCRRNNIKLKDDNRTLFVVNCNNLSELDLKRLFRDYGEIEDIQLGVVSKGNTKIAYIKFMEAVQVDNVLKDLQSHQYPKKVHSSTKVSFFQDSIEACHNQYVDPKELQETVFEQIESYNEEQAALPTRPYVTDDGWTVVPKRSTTDEDSMTTKQYKKKKTKELQNFYRFQIRENKRNQLMKLREQYESDKEKIEKMKQNRNFNPF